MPNRTSPALESLALAAISDGKSTSEAAAMIGVCVRAMHAIRRRAGLSTRAGRPRLITALSEDQQRLVEEHMEFARKVARRCLRDHSQSFDLDEQEYVSCAYMGLVAAASRWQEWGKFKTFCAVYIEGTIRDYRRAEMLANGWVFDTRGNERKFVKMLQRTGTSDAVDPVDGVTTK